MRPIVSGKARQPNRGDPPDGQPDKKSEGGAFDSLVHDRAIAIAHFRCELTNLLVFIEELEDLCTLSRGIKDAIWKLSWIERSITWEKGGVEGAQVGLVRHPGAYPPQISCRHETAPSETIFRSQRLDLAKGFVVPRSPGSKHNCNS